MTTQSPLETALASYLRSLAGANKSAGTIVAYRTDLQQFLAFLEETNITVAEPADVTRQDIAEYLNTLADQGRSGITRARKLAALREFFRFLEDQSLIAKNPTKGIETPKKERNGRNTLATGRVHQTPLPCRSQSPRLRDPASVFANRRSGE